METRSSIHWITSQMPLKAKIASAQSQDPKTPPESPIWKVWTQVLGPSPAASETTHTGGLMKERTYALQHGVSVSWAVSLLVQEPPA